uniref:LRAT domain-containing protein n=1 Tax=Fundulus heteroclitus TaxID=8078 RepID=A0A3Q2P6J0_FUNHE
MWSSGNKQQPKPGDLIEIFRSGYQHWAVYIGRGHVVHLVVTGDGSSVPVPGEMGVVLEQKLEEVVGNDRWRINNYLDKKRKPQQGYAIVKQAIGFIDARLPYSVIKSNCEHFATDLRYEKPTSRQRFCSNYIFTHHYCTALFAVLLLNEQRSNNCIVVTKFKWI